MESDLFRKGYKDALEGKTSDVVGAPKFGFGQIFDFLIPGRGTEADYQIGFETGVLARGIKDEREKMDELVDRLRHR